MSPAQIELVARLLLVYGPQVAMAFAKMFKTGATIDDAIAALTLAESKTAQQYREEA